MADGKKTEEQPRENWAFNALGLVGVIGFVAGLGAGSCIYEPNLVWEKKLNDDEIPDLVIETVGGPEHRYLGRSHGLYQKIEDDQPKEEKAELYSQR